jgi:hypothetical protein
MAELNAAVFDVAAVAMALAFPDTASGKATA